MNIDWGIVAAIAFGAAILGGLVWGLMKWLEGRP